MAQKPGPLPQAPNAEVALSACDSTTVVRVWIDRMDARLHLRHRVDSGIPFLDKLRIQTVPKAAPFGWARFSCNVGAGTACLTSRRYGSKASKMAFARPPNWSVTAVMFQHRHECPGLGDIPGLSLTLWPTFRAGCPGAAGTTHRCFQPHVPGR